MIPSYQEEIRIRKNKDRIFWVIVGIMTVFLYFFFQGYYPNYERFLDRPDASKQAFLKPFGIIDIHVFPSPDGIWINNEYYNNNSKTIFDLATYNVSIQKKAYITVNFLLDITKKSPFYTNVVNLFSLPEYTPLPVAFDSLSVYNDLYLVHSTGTGGLLLVDADFKILHTIATEYKQIGALYFTDGKNIFTYSLDTDKFTSIVDSETGLSLQCRDVSYYNEKLFCRDTMKFVGPKVSSIKEKILSINNNIAVTPKYIYNQDDTNTSWKYFEYETGALRTPEALVHINKIPYIFESGTLSPLDKTDMVVLPAKVPDWGMSIISQVRELEGETLLFGEKEGKGVFRIIDSEKQYAGVFDFQEAKDIKVYKVSGTYVFTTSKGAYIYYKGAKEIIKVLEDVNVIGTVDGKVFFNKD